MNDILNHIVPESDRYRHNDEGADDMPAHVKSSLMGCSVSIPISNGKLRMGTWQGIWLNEHRNHGGRRTVIATINGQRSKGDKGNKSNNTEDSEED